MVKRNERKPVVREKDIKQNENVVNLIFKITAIIGLVYCVQIESVNHGSVPLIVWVILGSAIVGKEVVERFLPGGKR